MLTCRSDIIFSGYSKLHLAEAGEVLGGDEGAVGEEADEGRHHVQEGGPVRGQGGHEQRGIEPRQHHLGEEEVICMITSLPYFGVKLSCVCLMFADRKK